MNQICLSSSDVAPSPRWALLVDALGWKPLGSINIKIGTQWKGRENTYQVWQVSQLFCKSVVFILSLNCGVGLRFTKKLSNKSNLSWSGCELALCTAPMKLWDFLDISKYPKILSLKSFSNLWSNLCIPVCY